MDLGIREQPPCALRLERYGVACERCGCTRLPGGITVTSVRCVGQSATDATKDRQRDQAAWRRFPQHHEERSRK